MFDFSELERLTRMAGTSGEEAKECFWYLTPPAGGTVGEFLDIIKLNSKSFRVINRMRIFMETQNITLYSQLFPDGMIKVSKIKQVPLIMIDDFYTRLQTLGLRKSRSRIDPLTNFLI